MMAGLIFEQCLTEIFPCVLDILIFLLQVKTLDETLGKKM